MSVSSRSVRVLHVDDDPGFADLAATYLEREDDRFDVETATRADEGLGRIDDAEFDCVVSDYDMPGKNGLDFLEAVREEHPELPFILFTGKGSEEIASEAISAGVTDYLQKQGGPDQYAVLANRIRNAVEHVQAKRQRQRHLDAIETAQEGISILDADGRYVYVNEAFADIHGYDAAELIGEHWELVYPDEDVPDVNDRILPAVESQGYWHGETTSVRADGSRVTVDHTLARTDRGELVCTVRNVSERKEREARLRQSSAKLEALFEHSPDMINVHDPEGTIVEANPTLAEETGYDPETLVGMKVWELDEAIEYDDARRLWDRMEVGDRRRLEGTYRRRDGSTFPVEVHLRRLRLDGADRFMAISRDVTERERRERALQEERDRLDEFAGTVSHDLRNPLQVAAGRLDLAREECDSDHLPPVADALDRMDRIVDDILTLARQGERIGATESVDLRDVVESAWELVPDGRAEADLVYRDADGSSPEIDADPDRMSRLLENLFRNAVDHAGPDVVVTVGALPDGFYVADDGPGVPAESRGQVFEPGYSTADDGTGFGLSIVEQIAEAHGWEVRIGESADGGARFEITGVEFR